MTPYAAILFIPLCALAWWCCKPRGRCLRGRELVGRVKQLEGQEEARVKWGGESIPRPNETMHFLVVGTTGSGKTTIIRNMMESVLPAIGKEPDQRAIVYDAKGDTLPFLRRLGCSVANLNPLDSDGCCWDMGRDIKDPITANEIAAIFITEEKGGSNRFFSDSARQVLACVMMVFMREAGESWTLRDVLFACRNEDALFSVLSCTQRGRDLYTKLLKSGRPGDDIKSTLIAALMKFEPVAALWANAERSVSIEEWAKGDFVLVLGDSEKGKTVFQALNRVIFKRAVEVVLDQSESTQRRNWFFVDEGKEARMLDGFSALLGKARSKGGAVVLGIQGVEGWRSVWGADDANEMLGMFSHKAMLRCESHETATWASKTIGEVECIEMRTSLSSDGSWKRNSRSTSENRVRTDAVLASQLQSIKPTNMRNGLTGFYTAAGIGVYERTLPLKDLIPRLGPEQEEEAFTARSSEEQWLEDWTSEDYERLGIVQRKCPVPEESLSSSRVKKRMYSKGSQEEPPQYLMEASDVEWGEVWEYEH